VPFMTTTSDHESGEKVSVAAVKMDSRVSGVAALAFFVDFSVGARIVWLFDSRSCLANISAVRLDSQID
jgi:hypothetical protein